MLYTLINVPYGALNSSLSRDTDEITILTSVRMFMANVGGLAVSAGIPILVAVIAASLQAAEAKDLPLEMALFMGLGSLPSFIFMPFVPAIKKAVGKKNMFYIFLTVAIVLLHQQIYGYEGKHDTYLYCTVRQVNRCHSCHRLYVGPHS